jgi:fructokinase
MNLICFCGEVVSDLVEFNENSGDFKLLLGGSQFHGAMGASRLNQTQNLNLDIAFVGPLSSDNFGDRFMVAMKDNKLNTDFICRVDRNTTLAVASIRPGRENAFSFYGRDTAEQMTKPEELPSNLPSPGTICVFGSISTVLEPARFTWLGFAKQQKQAGNLCMYDLNTRPSIIKSKEKYRDQVREWASVANVVKASDADIGWTYPDFTKEQVAAEWLSAGANIAVITMGSSGSFIATKNASAKVSGDELNCPNTIGAGDNFNAGLATILRVRNIKTAEDIAQLQSKDLQELLIFANNSAAQHLIRNGASLKKVA